eukprot:scaffold29424_cov101-Isochrysis_galbana.AAC.1
MLSARARARLEPLSAGVSAPFSSSRSCRGAIVALHAIAEVGGGALSKVRARLVQATAQPCQRDVHRLTMPIRSLSGQKTQCRHQLLRQRGRPLVHKADDVGADARQPVHEVRRYGRRQ